MLFIILDRITTYIILRPNVITDHNIDLCRQLHSPTNALLLSLAVSDLLVGTLLLPLDILFKEGSLFLSGFMCSLYYVVGFTITSSSVGNMVLISVDRYLAVCDPLHYATRVTLDRTKTCVCLCWICSVLYNTLILKDFLGQTDSQKSCYGQCLVVFKYNTDVVDLVFTFIGPIAVIILLYMRVFVVAVSQARAMRSHITGVTLHHLVTVKPKKSEMKAARSLGVIVAVFLICFCPYYSSSLVGEKSDDSSSFSPSAVWLLYFNSCLNPVIYVFIYPWFRKSVKLIVTLQILRPDSCDAKVL